MLEQFNSTINDDNKPRMLKKVWLKGQRGGAKWEMWVVQLICELLALGVPPSAIPASIFTVYVTLHQKEPDQVPSLSYVRQCRTVMQVMAETIAAIKLGIEEEWVQISTDATTRRHLAFQCLIISLIGADGKIDPVLVSSCIFLDDETAETTVQSIFEKVWPLCMSFYLFIQLQLNLCCCFR